MIVPGLKALPAGADTDQVTAVEAVPAMAAANCTWPPIVAAAGLGVTVTAGAL